MNEQPINIKSEIGKLRRVILHRPGEELENITPETMTDMLFDDIPYLKVARQEHDAFAKLLRERGAEVLYYNQLAAGALSDDVVREKFVEQLLHESKQNDRHATRALKQYLMEMDAQTMVNKVMAGVRKRDVKLANENSANLEAMVAEDNFPFFLTPMPNLYFSRDYAAAMGSGLTINHMTFGARKRDSLFMEYIMRYNPLFANKNVPVWYDRHERWNMEGGDEQIWTKDTVAVGLSQRSSPGAIEKLAERLLRAREFKRVVALEIPKSHALMHLDTVMTNIDYNKFTVFPEIMDKMGDMNIFILTLEGEKIRIQHRENLLDVVREVFGREDMQLIPTGGGDQIAAEREQWNDGSNTLAIAPGVVVTYDRNYVSNAMMRKAGVEVLEISGAELGRGRGGPRCMSMPIWREDL